MIVNLENYRQYSSSSQKSLFYVTHRLIWSGGKRLYLPQTRTMYLNGMKYKMSVNTQRAIMASQLKNGIVQLNVLNEKWIEIRDVSSQNRIKKRTSASLAENKSANGTKLACSERTKVVYECMNRIRNVTNIGVGTHFLGNDRPGA